LAPAGAGGASPAERDVPDPAEVVAEADYRRYLMQRVLAVVQRDFQTATWQAFWETVIEGWPAAEAAAEVGLKADAVYAALARVRLGLRQELEGLLDWGWPGAETPRFSAVPRQMICRNTFQEIKLRPRPRCPTRDFYATSPCATLLSSNAYLSRA